MSNHRSSVYFHLRTASRERMVKSFNIANTIVDSFAPNLDVQGTHSTYTSKKYSIKSKLMCYVKKIIPLVNLRFKGISLRYDFHYYWGCMPAFSIREHIIELDNPYCLTYYDTKIGNFRKRFIKSRLLKARHIVCMSQTSRGHTKQIFGDSISKKLRVSYPYMDDNLGKHVDNQSKIRFLFVGTDFILKGGRELLSAFTQIANPNISLTIVSSLSEDSLGIVDSDSRITVIPLCDGKTLMENVYPNHDIFILPSLYESFGVVLLEALSFGMGIISVQTYATHEVVKDGINGCLIHHPILKTEMVGENEVVSCVKYTISDFKNKYIKKELNETLVRDLKMAIEVGVENSVQWSKASSELFAERFSPEVWKANFLSLIEG